MSSLFFIINFSAALISLGSCPSSITKSSSDLILLSLAYEEVFSNFYCVVMLSNELCSLCAAMGSPVKVE